jgi:adenylosuccinate synthase
MPPKCVTSSTVGPYPRLLADCSDVPATVIVGAQWGDEGKGKIVDLLAQDSDLVCRYQGGPNAGHTIVVGDVTYKIRQIPSGVIRGKTCVIGAGCVVDPEVFLGEVDELEARGHSTADVHVSGEAHLIMPWHVAIDQASERRLGKLQIGTTRRGIGPCYADKAARLGIRVQDVLEPKILRQKIEVALAEKNVWLERVYGVEPFELEELAARLEEYAQRLRPYIADTSLLVDRALYDGKDVLLEGGQGTLLDLDHGTYPFVTSSSTVAANAATGVGIGPTRIDEVIGVAKAYVTRVGEGPFPTEIEGPDQERVCRLGGEIGTVTGRVRRCGWLDLVALRYAVRLNGFTSLALTKLDVLSSFAELPVCVAYRLRDGTQSSEFPAHQSDFHHCRPVYELLPGWEEPITDGLPPAARAYVDFVEQALGVEISLVGTGAERESVVALR